MPKKNPCWTTENIEFIQNNYTIMTDNAIAITLSKITGKNISTDMVRAKRRNLNINKKRGKKRNN